MREEAVFDLLNKNSLGGQFKPNVNQGNEYNGDSALENITDPETSSQDAVHVSCNV